MIFIRNINLRRWFPPDNDFAASVARMSILREDFAIEMMGVYEKPFLRSTGTPSTTGAFIFGEICSKPCLSSGVFSKR
jgi:hypothetical protein